MPFCGLTGGIGSGKSTVARMLGDIGAVILDADAIARHLTNAGGAAMPAIKAEFGADFITSEGALDRKRMRDSPFTTALRRGAATGSKPAKQSMKATPAWFSTFHYWSSPATGERN
jgi:dephospho-CoA kinase